MKIINLIFSKKNILILLSILSAYLVIALFWDNNRDFYPELFKNFIYPLELIGNTGVFAPFVLLPFSIITYFISSRTFYVWRNWTACWLILYGWIMFDSVKNPYHGSLGVYSSIDPYGFVPVFVLYIIVSIVVILVLRSKEKYNK